MKKYFCWDDGSLYHARAFEGVRGYRDLMGIPADAVMIEAETGAKAVEQFRLKGRRH